MSHFANNTFSDRRNDAAAAKKAQLEKFRASLNSNDPEVARRRAEREAIAAARKAREAEKEAARLAAEAKAAEEKAAREAAEAAAEAERQAILAAEEAARPSSMIREAALWAERRAKGRR